VSCVPIFRNHSLEYESTLNPLDRLWFTSSGLILGGAPMWPPKNRRRYDAAHCDTGRSVRRMNERLSSGRSGWRRSGSGAGGLLTYRGFPRKYVLKSSPIAWPSANATVRSAITTVMPMLELSRRHRTIGSGFGRVPPQVHMRAKSQREQHQLSFAPSFARIAISLRRARARRDITVPAGTPVTPLISR
jgi:hypothetical protein